MVYRTAAAALALSPEQASYGYTAQIRGVVTESAGEGMEIHDLTSGIWVYWKGADNFSAGDELEVQGVLAPGKFAPVINAVSVRKLGRSSLPDPKPVTFKQLSSGNMDGQYVAISGVVRSVGIQNAAPRSEKVLMKVKVDGGFLVATLPEDDLAAADKMIDATVNVIATAMCSKNNNRQIIAPTLAASSLRNITILRPPPADLFSEPLTPIGRVMQYRSGTDFDHRVRIAGQVTFYKPGESLILEDHGDALYTKTTQNADIALGDRVEALGFPSPRDSGPILVDTILRRISAGRPLQPTPVKLSDLCAGKLNYNLVSTEARLLRQVNEPSREVLLLQDGRNILLAELASHRGANLLRQIPEGSQIRVVGINTLEINGTWNYGVDSAEAVRCNVLLRSDGDVQMLQPPTWWTTRHVLYLAAVLGILALVFLFQVVRNIVERWRLDAVIAERERLGHDIHDTLAQSFAGIGFQLQAIRREIPRDLARLQQQVNLAQNLVRHSHKEARRSLEPLRLDSEETPNLLPALEQCARRMVEGGQVEISASVSGSPRQLPLRVASTLLRIGQEAIANAVRHADPRHLEIFLLYQKNMAILSIRDDGAGFVKSGDLLGFGLRGMRKRAAAISAKLDILSQVGSGTCITVTVPLPPVFTVATMLTSFWKNLSEHLLNVDTKQ